MLKPTGRRSRRVGVVLAVGLVGAGAAWAGGGPVAVGASETGGTTSRVSVSSNETQSNGERSARDSAPAISPNGRFVVFTDTGSLEDGADTNDASDVFVRDQTLGTTQRVSMSSAEVRGNAGSYAGAISADGRYVAFQSVASNLVPADTNTSEDVFVRDRMLGTTSRVSVSSNEGQRRGRGSSVSISADGRYVAFSSTAAHLVRGDTNHFQDVFVRDRRLGTTIRVSVSSSHRQGNQASYAPVLSADGLRVVYFSGASNLVTGDTNRSGDVFLWYRPNRTTHRVSLSSSEHQGNATTEAPVSVSIDGRYVAMNSNASNLASGDTNTGMDVFVRDRVAGTTQRVSVNTNEAQGDDYSREPSISANGRRVSFFSYATNFVDGDTPFTADIFVRDRVAGTTRLASLSSDGRRGNGLSVESAISGDGRQVAFTSEASNLVPGDTNGIPDTFVRVLEP